MSLMNAPKLEKVLILNFDLQNVTGLLISGGRSVGRIGGADIETVSIEREYMCGNEKAVSVRARVPYIPGSSLKGRMRSLLELSHGLQLFSNDGKIWAHTPSPSIMVDLNETKLDIPSFVRDLSDHNHKLDRLFGFSSFSFKDLLDSIKSKEDKSNQPPQTQTKQQLSTEIMNLSKSLTPTLLLVDDLFLSSEDVCRTFKENGVVTFVDFLEEKNENRIDRITSAADPRTINRVRPGLHFEGKISLLVFDRVKNELKDYLNLLVEGMKLLEKTYLGASGSRGYGRVSFKNISVKIYDVSTNKTEDFCVTVNQKQQTSASTSGKPEGRAGESGEQKQCAFGSLQDFESEIGKLVEMIVGDVTKGSTEAKK